MYVARLQLIFNKMHRCKKSMQCIPQSVLTGWFKCIKCSDKSPCCKSFLHKEYDFTFLSIFFFFAWTTVISWGNTWIIGHEKESDFKCFLKSYYECVCLQSRIAPPPPFTSDHRTPFTPLSTRQVRHQRALTPLLSFLFDACVLVPGCVPGSTQRSNFRGNFVAIGQP